MPRSNAELKDQFDQQSEALDQMCAQYDEGRKWAAKYIASIIYVFVYDKGKTKSLLTQMGELTRHYFTSSGRINPGNLLPSMPLTLQLVDTERGVHTFEPLLEDARAPRGRLSLSPFQGWWGQTVICDGPHTLSRSQMASTFRDQEGGGHFDSDLSLDLYKRMAQEGETFFQAVINGKPVATVGPHFATMRQIGWEMQDSLARIRKSLL